MQLKQFDPGQPLEAYYAGKDRQRVQGLQDYQQGRRVEMDRRGDEEYQRQEEKRPALEARASQLDRIKQDKELGAYGKNQMLSMNPDSPTFDEDIMKAADDFGMEMKRRGYSDQDIAEHQKRMFQSGALSPDNVRFQQEQAGLRRQAIKPTVTPLQREKIDALKKKEEAATMDRMAESQSAIDAIDNTIGTIDRLTEGEGLEKATGWQSAFPTAPGTEAANFEAMLETLQSQAFLSQVKQMKGMGALSENEGKKLGAAIGSLSTSMSDSVLRAELKRIKDMMTKAKQKMISPKGEKEPAVIKFGDL